MYSAHYELCAVRDACQVGHDDSDSLCDGVVRPEDCVKPCLELEDSLAGAIERYRRGEIFESDLEHLVQTQANYEILSSPYLGPSIRSDGYTTFPNRLWEESLVVTAQTSYIPWTQQWPLLGSCSNVA